MHEHLPFLQGGGHLGEMIRKFDWANSTLKSPEGWPESLRAAVAISLNSGFPIAIYWGKDFTLLYNDAWSSIPGQKHPWSLGKPGSVVWPEIWEGLKEEFESVLQEGLSYRRPDAPLYMHRYGYTEECYFDYTLSPIVAVDGSIGGVFNAVIETSYRVINERRSVLRSAFLGHAHSAANVEIAHKSIASLLQNAILDIPFFAYYFGNDLTFCSCLNPSQLADITEIVEGTDSNEIVQLDHLDIRLSEPAHCHWPEPVSQALILPVFRSDGSVKGRLVLAASARKRIDEDYRNFLVAIAANTGTILNNAAASELTLAYQNELLLNAELHEEQQALSEEISAANEELSAANEELFASNEELAAANEELASTNEELTETQLLLQRTFNELAENERKSKFMLNAIPQQVWTADPMGNLNYVNQIISGDFGHPVSEIIRHGWQQYIHPDDLPSFLLSWEQALSGGEEYLTEFRLKFADGEYHWHLSRAVPLVEEGKVSLWLGTNTNIEPQKRNEQQKDEFLSIASHELKTPLTGIKAFTQLMQKSTDLNRITSYLAKSNDNIFRLEKLINDLLDVTKINAGKLTYDLQAFNFSDMLRDAVESAQLTTNHQIILEQSDNLTITGDRMRLEQVINNFLSNAIKYSPGANQVLVKSKPTGDAILVSIQDFGIGIQEEHIKRLFDRYYRIDNSAMRFEGLGLGLFISSEILKRHMGTFWIESEPGEGSTFYFRLPITEPKPATPFSEEKQYFKNDHITIFQDKINQWLEVDWIGFQTLEAVKSGGMMMIEMLRDGGFDKVMNDNTNVMGTWSEASDWAGQEWFPMMDDAGLRYFAWVYSPSAFSRLSAEKAVDVKVGNAVVRFFTDTETAREWLRSLDT